MGNSRYHSRLYSYYQQRPLAGKMRSNFEDLVVKLEMRLAGESRPRARGNYLSPSRRTHLKNQNPESQIEFVTQGANGISKSGNGL